MSKTSIFTSQKNFGIKFFPVSNTEELKKEILTPYLKEFYGGTFKEGSYGKGTAIFEMLLEDGTEFRDSNSAELLGHVFISKRNANWECYLDMAVLPENVGKNILLDNIGRIKELILGLGYTEAYGWTTNKKVEKTLKAIGAEYQTHDGDNMLYLIRI